MKLGQLLALQAQLNLVENKLKRVRQSPNPYNPMIHSLGEELVAERKRLLDTEIGLEQEVVVTQSETKTHDLSSLAAQISGVEKGDIIR